MKITKKLLCMALSVIMLVSCLSTVAFAADEKESGTKFSDVSANEIYSMAVSTLNVMGVINGYEDGTFKPEQNVTRAEFTAMLMRTLNYGKTGSTSAADLPFTDIDDNDTSINWAIPNINTAYGMGIINGYEDSTFRPNANVAFEEAIKMIVCTLGYGNNVDVNVDPWYANYIAIAAQIGLTKNANKLGAAGTPATRACIAQLLYDCLEIDIIEQNEKTDKTILSDYLGYIKNVGVISSNDITSLTEADVNLREDEIQITAREEGESRESTHTYSTTDLTLKDHLGYEVEFYYKSSGSDIRTLMFCVITPTEPITINAANIEESRTTDSQIKYYKNLDDDRESTIGLESDNVVIYNGKLYGDSANDSRFETDMLPEVGSIKFIDSDNNGKYDIIDIVDYEIFYVSTKNSTSYEIVDNLTRPEDRKTLKLNTDEDRNLKIVNESGNEMTFSSIATGNIICYARSNGSDPISKAIVCTNKVTGTVTAIRGEKITISNKEYRYSKAAPWVTGATSLEEPVTQDSGTFYFDINGDLVAYDKNASTENIVYGYILGYTEDKFEGTAVFRVLTSAGAETRIGTYKSTKVDGETCSDGQEVIRALEESAKNQNTGGNQDVQQLVKYSTRTSDGKTVFNKIYTAEAVAAADIETDELHLFEGIDENDDMEYNSSSKTLTGGGSNIKVTNSIVFSIPEDRTDYDGFKKTTVSSSFKNTNKYNVEFFDVNKSNVATVVVLYGADNSQAVDSTSPIYIVNAHPGEGEWNGETKPQLEGYKVTMDGMSTFTEFFSDESTNINDLEIGDIFRAGTDRDNLPLFDDKYMLFDVDGRNEFGINKDPAGEDMYRAEYVTIMGSVISADDANIMIAPEELNEGDEQEDASNNITFSISEFDSAAIFTYVDGQSGLELEKASDGDYEAILTSLSTLESGEPSKVLIYMTEGDIMLLCVLPTE